MKKKKYERNLNKIKGMGNELMVNNLTYAQKI